MTLDNFIIREITSKDNPKIAAAIRNVLIEFGVPKVGTAYSDPHLDTLFEEYTCKNSVYFVVEKDGEIFGGAGVKKLDNYEGNVCELQKMYFMSEVRGIGLGSKMMDICIQNAKKFGFEKCYLETLPYMEQARELYRKVGFKNIDERLGNTGHFSCNLFMLKDL